MSPAEVGLSIIIPVRNGEASLADQLGALASETFSSTWEVLIVDNGSTDRTPEIIGDFMSRCPHARALSLPHLKNASQVRNAAARMTHGKALAFLDADDVIAPGWVESIGEAVREYPLVSGRMEFHSLNPTWAIASRRLIQTEALSTVFGSRAISIGNSACQRWLWEALSGLDDGLSAGEDTDFSIRAHRQLGIEATFVPNAILHYRFRQRWRDILSQAFVYGASDPQLFIRYGNVQEIRRLRIAIRAYAELLVLAVAAPFSRHLRTRFTWALGKRLGRLIGSIKHRVFYL